MLKRDNSATRQGTQLARRSAMDRRQQEDIEENEENGVTMEQLGGNNSL